MNTPWTRYLPKEWLIFGICLFVLIIFYFTLGVTGPLFLIAWFFAYLTFPFIKFLERRGARRAQAVGITIALLVFILFGIIALLGPWLYAEARQLVNELPGIFEWVSDRLTDLHEWLVVRFNVETEDFGILLRENWIARFQDLGFDDIELVKPFVTGGIGIALFVAQLLLLPIFYIYLLFHLDRIPGLIERMIPAQVLPTYQRYIIKFDRLILGYIQGMFLVTCFLAFSYAVGLSLSGVQFGFIVGIFAGFISFIPYLGFFVGIALTVLLILVYGGGLGTWIGFVLTFTIAQLIESYYMTPRLVGSRVGLHPIVVILLIIAGANMAGLAGMIIAIPLGAMIWILIDDLLNEKQKTELGDLPD